MIGVARGHRARRRLRRRRRSGPPPRRDGDDYVVNGAKTFITSGVRADFVTTAVRTGGARATPGSRLLVDREGHARLHRRPARWPRWAGTAPTPPSCRFVDVRVPVGQPGRRGGLGLLPDRRAVRRRADRAGGPRLRHRRPRAGARPRRTAGSARPSASRSSPTRWSGTSSSRCTGRSRWRGPTPTRSPRGTSPARASSPRPAWRSRPRSTRATYVCRPGRPAARRHGVPARDRGGAALPRRPDPADRRRSDRGADGPGRTAAGVLVMSALDRGLDRRLTTTAAADAGAELAELDAERRAGAVAGGGGEVRRAPPRPRQAAAPRADRAAGRPGLARSSSCARSPAGARTSRSGPAWSPASASSRASSA